MEPPLPQYLLPEWGVPGCRSWREDGKKEVELVNRTPSVGVGALDRVLGDLGWNMRAYVLLQYDSGQFISSFCLRFSSPGKFLAC